MVLKEELRKLLALVYPEGSMHHPVVDVSLKTTNVNLTLVPGHHLSH